MRILVFVKLYIWTVVFFGWWFACFFGQFELVGRRALGRTFFRHSLGVTVVVWVLFELTYLGKLANHGFGFLESARCDGEIVVIFLMGFILFAAAPAAVILIILDEFHIVVSVSEFLFFGGVEGLPLLDDFVDKFWLSHARKLMFVLVVFLAWEFPVNPTHLLDTHLPPHLVWIQFIILRWFKLILKKIELISKQNNYIWILRSPRTELTILIILVNCNRRLQRFGRVWIGLDMIF